MFVFLPHEKVQMKLHNNIFISTSTYQNHFISSTSNYIITFSFLFPCRPNSVSCGLDNSINRSVHRDVSIKYLFCAGYINCEILILNKIPSEPLAYFMRSRIQPKAEATYCCCQSLLNVVNKTKHQASSVGKHRTTCDTPCSWHM